MRDVTAEPTQEEELARINKIPIRLSSTSQLPTDPKGILNLATPSKLNINPSMR